MAGITRIHILSDWHNWRLKMNQELEPAANLVHIATFAEVGMPLLPRIEIIECTEEEAMARYDWQEGIDCILHFRDGTKATMQEKYLVCRFSRIPQLCIKMRNSGKKKAMSSLIMEFFKLISRRMKCIGFQRETIMKSAEFMQWVTAIAELDHHQRKLLSEALHQQ